MAKKSEVVIKVSGDAKSFLRTLDEVGKKTARLETALNTIAKKSAIAFAALTAALALTVKNFASFEFALEGVGKTADLAGEELDDFGKSVQDLSRSLPFSTQELLSISKAAGQLGVKGKANLLKFTETIAKLGTASDLAGEEAAIALTRILNVTGEGIDTIDKFASVIVALGNNFAASESEIARMTTEVARSLAVFGASAAQAAALGTAMRSLGIRAESGGSAVGRAFLAIDASIRDGGKSLEDLSRITGIAGDQLKQTFADDATKVFQLFIEGIGRAEHSTLGITGTLDKFGLAGQEILKVLPPLAKNSKLLAEALNLAAKETKNATALEREYAKISETLNVKSKILANTLGVLSEEIGVRLKPLTIEMIDLTKSWLDAFLDLDEGVKDATVDILKYTAAILGIVSAVATVTLVLVGFRALFIAVGVAAAAAWAQATLGLSLIVSAVVLAVTSMGGLEGSIIRVEAAFKVLSNRSEIVFNKLRFAINNLIAKTFELTAATLQAIPGNAFADQIRMYKELASAARGNSEEIISANKKLRISFEDVVKSISIERELEKNTEAQKKAAVEAARIAEEARLLKEKAAIKDKAAEEKAIVESLERKRLAEEQKIALEKEQRIRRKETEDEIKVVELELEEVESLEEEARLIVKLERLQEIRDEFLTKEELSIEKTLERLKKLKKRDEKNELKRTNNAFNDLLLASGVFFKTEKSLEERFQEFKSDSRSRGLKDSLRIGEALFKGNKGISKAIFAVNKAIALKEVIVSTAAGIARANKDHPFPVSAVIGGLIAASGAAQSAAIIGAVIGAQKGAFVGDGVSAPSGDRFPFLLEKGEIVAPKRNFDEVVESVARSRGFTKSGEQANNGFAILDESPQQEVSVMISLTDDAAQIITAQQFENTTLGADR